jgi:hypothetical protein
LLARAFEECDSRNTPRETSPVFCISTLGEAAVAVGVLYAGEPADYIVTTCREQGHGWPRHRVRDFTGGHRDRRYHNTVLGTCDENRCRDRIERGWPPRSPMAKCTSGCLERFSARIFSRCCESCGRRRSSAIWLHFSVVLNVQRAVAGAARGADPALGPGYMRITTALPEDNRHFVDALREVLSGA